jgi:hypothetical protein
LNSQINLKHRWRQQSRSNKTDSKGDQQQKAPIAGMLESARAVRALIRSPVHCIVTAGEVKSIAKDHIVVKSTMAATMKARVTKTVNNGRDHSKTFCHSWKENKGVTKSKSTD